MAKNRKYSKGAPLKLPVPSGTESGMPVAVGPVARPIAGVALVNRDSEGNAVCDCEGVYEFEVKGENGSGGSKVEIGDTIFLTTGVLSKIATGAAFGAALGVVASGATTKIAVRIGF